MCTLGKKPEWDRNTVAPFLSGNSHERSTHLRLYFSCTVIVKYYWIVPLKRDHPSNKACFPLLKGWPYKRGTTLHWKCFTQGTSCPQLLPDKIKLPSCFPLLHIYFSNQGSWQGCWLKFWNMIIQQPIHSRLLKTDKMVSDEILK